MRCARPDSREPRAAISGASRAPEARMPEGDTIFRTATVLRRALAGRVVTGFELVAPKVTPSAARRRVVGGKGKAVESKGKHLMITFTTNGGDVGLHNHIRLQGPCNGIPPGRWAWL